MKTKAGVQLLASLPPNTYLRFWTGSLKWVGTSEKYLPILSQRSDCGTQPLWAWMAWYLASCRAISLRRVQTHQILSSAYTNTLTEPLNQSTLLLLADMLLIFFISVLWGVLQTTFWQWPVSCRFLLVWQALWLLINLHQTSSEIQN